MFVSLVVILAFAVFVFLRLKSKECNCEEFDEETGNSKERD